MLIPLDSRFGRGLVFALAIATGCVTGSTPLPAPVPYPSETASAGLVLRTALADRPAGDRYLSEGIWTYATHPLPHELSAVLARNGLRAGVLTGVPPAEFVALWNDHDTLIDPANRSFTPGQAQVIPVAGPIAECALQLTSTVAADAVPARYTSAECGLAITTSTRAEGHVTLDCEPRFQHGEPRTFILPAADATFTRRERKARESFTHLAFQVTLGPGDALIVGPTREPAGTLGGAFFVEANPSRARQRLLIVQCRP